MQNIHVVVSNTHNKEQKGRTDRFRALTDGQADGWQTDLSYRPTLLIAGSCRGRVRTVAVEYVVSGLFEWLRHTAEIRVAADKVTNL